MQCTSCPYPCQSCLNSSYCLSCDQAKSTMYLTDGECSSTCPKNFVLSTDKPHECTQCSADCLECSATPDQCTSCRQYSDLPYLLGSKCVAQCSGAYGVASNGQTCLMIQEQIVPFPFLSLSLLTIMAIGIIKMAKRKIQFKDTAIAITMIILFANWIYLLAKVYQDQHWESTIILSYAILSQLIINTVWNYFYFKTLRKDEQYSMYLSANNKKSILFVFMTMIGSFQFFRLMLGVHKNLETLTPSKDIEKSQTRVNADLCGVFTNPIRVQRVILKLSVVSLSCSFFPVMIQNIYNLFYTGPQRQVFFTDIESFAHSLFVGVLIIVDIKKKRAKILNLIQEAKKEINDGHNQTVTNYNNITPRSYSANKDITDPYLGLLQSQEDLQRFEHIMQKFIKHKKAEVERSFTNSQIDDRLELNDLVSKETCKKEALSRYEGQSVTTNRSFQNLVSNYRHSGLQQSNTLYSDRILGTSFHQNLQQKS